MAKILVIDDSRYTRLKIVEFLEANGLEVIEAENGISGLEITRAEKPACIVTDLLMPEMDGYEFLENLKKEGIEIPVVVITADIQETTREKVIQLGADSVINKPTDYAQLLKLIRSAHSLYPIFPKAGPKDSYSCVCRIVGHRMLLKTSL